MIREEIGAVFVSAFCCYRGEIWLCRLEIQLTVLGRKTPEAIEKVPGDKQIGSRGPLSRLRLVDIVNSVRSESISFTVRYVRNLKSLLAGTESTSIPIWLTRAGWPIWTHVYCQQGAQELLIR